MVYRSTKFKLLIIVIMIALPLAFYAYNWQSLDVNQSAADNLHQCIYKSDNKRSLKVSSLNNELAITYVEKSNFFSYRRDGETGRMASLVWLG